MSDALDIERWETGISNHMRVHVRPLRNVVVGCPIMMTLEYPRIVEHEFCIGERGGCIASASGSLRVPVKILLENHAKIGEPEASFEFIVEDPKECAPVASRGSGCPMEKYGTLGCVFAWSGVTKTKINDLAPGERRAYTIFATFNAPGVYDLNYFSLVFRVPGNEEGKMVKYVFPSEYRTM